MEIENKNLKKTGLFFAFLHRKICYPIHGFLSKLISICEDSKLKNDIENARRKMEESVSKIDYLDAHKEEIFESIGALKSRITFLKNALNECEKERYLLLEKCENEIIFKEELLFLCRHNLRNNDLIVKETLYRIGREYFETRL